MLFAIIVIVIVLCVYSLYPCVNTLFCLQLYNNNHLSERWQWSAYTKYRLTCFVHPHLLDWSYADKRGDKRPNKKIDFLRLLYKVG